jgi:tRNA (cmo5U34)-methyltransferase
MAETKGTTTWSEDDSQHFIDYGAYFVPEREVQIDTIVSVIPPADGPVHMVELCSGEGLLAEALATRFKNAAVHAYDGSEAMLASTAAKLAAHGDGHTTHLFEIADTSWRRFDWPLHAVVSSLAIHHLDGPGKAQLFKDIAAALEPGGAFVICDIVEAQTPEAQALWVRHWDDGVRGRSLELDGNEKMLDFFREDGWNYYVDPDADPVDMPSPLVDQLGWLADAGFEHVDVHWLKAGHAIFSGRKPKP